MTDQEENVEIAPETKLTKAEYIQNWIVNTIIRVLDNVFPLILSGFLALVVAFISSHFDHLIHILSKYIEYIGSWRYLTAPLFLCISALIVQIIHPTARGSGIPEMKLFLSNWESPRMVDYLSLKAFLVKIIGLGLSISSGFPVGKEGPFVHISCTAAYLIKFQLIPKLKEKVLCNFRRLLTFCNCSFFKTVGQHYLQWKLRYKRNVDVYRFLCTGCALGVACTFGAPIGGVMFSIEVTSQIFDISNYWHCFFTGITGALFFRFFIGGILNETWYFKPYLKSNLPGEEYEFYHFIVYIGIGITCGILGSIFIFIYFIFFKTGQIMYRILNFIFRKLATKNTFSSGIFHPRTSNRRIVVSVIFTLIVSGILVAGDFIQMTDFQMPISQHSQLALFFDDGQKLMEVFNIISKNESVLPKNIHEEIDLKINFNNYLLPLLMFLMMKMLFFCPIITCLPIPNGIFFPLMVGGACLGRLLGDLTKISSAGCAIVGAAGLSGAVTHSVSTAVIITEMTEEIQYLIPCAVAAYTGQLIAHILAKYSIYEMIMRNRKMPYLPDTDEDIYPIFQKAKVESFIVSGNYINIQTLNKLKENPNVLYTHIYSNIKEEYEDEVVEFEQPNIRKTRAYFASKNEDLRRILVNIKAKKSEIQWKLIPVVRIMENERTDNLVGFIRCEAAEVYLEKYFEMIMHSNSKIAWWLQNPDQIPDTNLNSSGNVILEINGCCCCKTDIEYNKSDWKSFLKEEINWSELFEEIPCSVTLGTSLPDVQSFCQKNFLPQVFIVDNHELKGIITRENIIEQIKKLHRQCGKLAVAYRGDLMTLPMKSMLPQNSTTGFMKKLKIGSKQPKIRYEMLRTHSE